MAAHASASGPDADPALVAEALDGLLEGIQILSPAYRYLYLNEAAARQGRKPRAELLGKTMLECYPGIDATPMFSVLSGCMRERRAASLDNEFTYEDGRRAWFELRMRPCPAGVVLVSVDITERKGVELRLQEAYGQALRDLLTPVIRVYPGVLLVPLVGALDRRRAARVTDDILTRTESEAAKVVILDIAGVPALDTEVATHLVQTTAMLRLLGATSILTGVGRAAARALVHLGFDLSTMETTAHLAEGLELALAKLGRAIVAAKT